MRTTLYFGLAFVFATFQSLSPHAQEFSAQLIGGFNVSQIEGDNLVGYNQGGLVAGGATNFQLNDQWSLQQEIVYYQRGSSASEDQLFDDDFTILRLDYIDVLFLPVYHFDDRWSLAGGAGLGFFINSKTDFGTRLSFRNDLFATLGPQYRLGHNWYGAIRMQFSMRDVIADSNALNNSISFTLRCQL